MKVKIKTETYKNQKQMDKRVAKMMNKGWEVKNIIEQVKGRSFGVFFFIGFLSWLLPKRRFYVVTFQKNV